MSTASIFRIKFLFQKYLDNVCSQDELDELFDLIAQEENLSEIEGLLGKLWSDVSPQADVDPEQHDQEFLYNKLLSIIKKEKNTYSFQRKSFSPLIWSAAASIILCVCAGIYFTRTKPVAPTIVQAAKAKPARHAKEIRLADGSIVLLNKDSHLDYPVKFTGKTREVYLTGEAYFDIKHDPLHPFLVHTRQITTRVLGTAFNIKAYGSLVQVTVTRGKVKVSTSKRTLGVILPNQQISYNNATRQSSQSVLNAKTAVLWKETDLVMDQMTLKDAATLLTERYGVNITLDNSKIENCRFSATFLNTTSFEQVIKVLSHLNNLSYKRNGTGQLILSGPGCE